MSDSNIKIRALLSTLVPAEEGFPSAGELDIHAAFTTDVETDGNEGLVEQLLSALPEDFARRSDSDREAVLKALEREQPATFAGVLRHIYNVYYTNEVVREVLEKVDGYPARPPLYAGYEMEKFDIESLVVQRKRKPFWRKVTNLHEKE